MLPGLENLVCIFRTHARLRDFSANVFGPGAWLRTCNAGQRVMSTTHTSIGPWWCILASTLTVVVMAASVEVEAQRRISYATYDSAKRLGELHAYLDSTWTKPHRGRWFVLGVLELMRPTLDAIRQERSVLNPAVATSLQRLQLRIQMLASSPVDGPETVTVVRQAFGFVAELVDHLYDAHGVAMTVVDEAHLATIEDAMGDLNRRHPLVEQQEEIDRFVRSAVAMLDVMVGQATQAEK
jgi:hypothetical protein